MKYINNSQRKECTTIKHMQRKSKLGTQPTHALAKTLEYKTTWDGHRTLWNPVFSSVLLYLYESHSMMMNYCKREIFMIFTSSLYWALNLKSFIHNSWFFFYLSHINIKKINMYFSLVLIFVNKAKQIPWCVLYT